MRAGERRVRDLAETGSDWFWEQDADLRFIWISADSPVRRPEDQSYIGQTRWDRAGADPTDPHWAAHKADLETRRPFRDFRYHRLNRDGRELHVSISGNPVYDDACRFIGYRGTGRDVTARMQAQEELREAKEQAEAASRMKTTAPNATAMLPRPNITAFLRIQPKLPNVALAWRPEKR